MKPKAPIEPQKRYVVKTRDGVIVANGVSHTEAEIVQIKAAGHRVKEVKA